MDQDYWGRSGIFKKISVTSSCDFKTSQSSQVKLSQGFNILHLSKLISEWQAKSLAFEQILDNNLPQNNSTNIFYGNGNLDRAWRKQKS